MRTYRWQLSPSCQQIKPDEVSDRSHVSGSCQVSLFPGTCAAAAAFGAPGISGTTSAKRARIAICNNVQCYATVSAQGPKRMTSFDKLARMSHLSSEPLMKVVQAKGPQVASNGQKGSNSGLLHKICLSVSLKEVHFCSKVARGKKIALRCCK